MRINKLTTADVTGAFQCTRITFDEDMWVKFFNHTPFFESQSHLLNMTVQIM